MAAERKLKGEIDRTLKKVIEGQELFEELWVQVKAGSSELASPRRGMPRLAACCNPESQVQCIDTSPTVLVGSAAGSRLRQQQPAREARGRAEEGD